MYARGGSYRDCRTGDFLAGGTARRCGGKLDCPEHEREERIESVEEPGREIKHRRERQTLVGEACVCVNESLDFESVLQPLVDTALSLTDAVHGKITGLDDVGRVQGALPQG